MAEARGKLSKEVWIVKIPGIAVAFLLGAVLKIVRISSVAALLDKTVYACQSRREAAEVEADVDWFNTEGVGVNLDAQRTAGFGIADKIIIKSVADIYEVGRIIVIHSAAGVVGMSGVNSQMAGYIYRLAEGN